MDDQAIIDLYWDRSEEAIVQTDKKYGKYCFTIANRILENPDDSEECVSDTYMSAWNRMPPVRPQILSVFLGKITRNISVSRWRKQSAVKSSLYRSRKKLGAVLKKEGLYEVG